MVRKVFQVQVIENNSGWNAHKGMVYDVRNVTHDVELYRLVVTERNTDNMDKVCLEHPGQVEYRDHIYHTGRACLPMDMAVRVTMNNEGSLCNMKEDGYEV